MSLYILDTDTVSLFQHNHLKVSVAVLAHDPKQVAISVLTVEEQLSGWYKELRATSEARRLAMIYERMAITTQFLGRLPIIPFSEQAIVRWQELKKLKLNIGKTDLRIAAIVLELGAVVVARNSSDFCRVPGLTIEDWSK